MPMANCPKCEHHLKLTDWKQKCPYCGANIFMYNLQERLMQQADKAEVEYYHYQKRVDRVKASFLGSKLAIARIFTSLLPALAVLLPLMNVAFSEPAKAVLGLETLKFDALSIYNNIDSIDFGALLNAAMGSIDGKIFILAVLCFVVSLLFLVIHFVFLLLSCSPKGKKRNYTFDILSLVFAAVFAGTALFIPAGDFASVTVGIGAWLYVFLCAVNFAVDILVFKQGIKIKHKQCYVGGIPIEEYFKMVEDGVSPEELRKEMYRRLSAQQKEKERELEEQIAKGKAEAEEKREKEAAAK